MTRTADAKSRSGVRTLVSAVLIIVGVLACISAIVNWYNIDPQPMWLLLVMGAFGVSATVAGIRLSRRVGP